MDAGQRSTKEARPCTPFETHSSHSTTCSLPRSSGSCLASSPAFWPRSGTRRLNTYPIANLLIRPIFAWFFLVQPSGLECLPFLSLRFHGVVVWPRRHPELVIKKPFRRDIQEFRQLDAIARSGRVPLFQPLRCRIGGPTNLSLDLRVRQALQECLKFFCPIHNNIVTSSTQQSTYRKHGLML